MIKLIYIEIKLITFKKHKCFKQNNSGEKNLSFQQNKKILLKDYIHKTKYRIIDNLFNFKIIK